MLTATLSQVHPHTFTPLPGVVACRYSDCLRGRVRQTLTPAISGQIGLALGSEARVRGFSKVVVGRDGQGLQPEGCALAVR